MAEYGEPLTDRELDVLGCIANGASNRETALQLSISPNTVKVHTRNIYTKLGVSSRTEATTAALQLGLLTMPGIEIGPETGDRGPVEESEPGRSRSQRDDLTADGGPQTAERPEAGRSLVQHDDLAGNEAVPQAETRNPRLLWLVAGAGVVLVVVIAIVFWVLRDEGSAVASPAGTTAVTGSPTFIETPIPDSNWSISRDLPQPRAHMASAIVGLNLYQIGGQTADGVSNEVEIYRLDERLWSSGAPKLTPVTEAGAVELAGEIFVLGGRLASGELTGVVEAYSPLNDGWRPVTSLPAPTAGGLALANDNFIYYFGGLNGDTPIANSYRYDQAGQTWETLPPMPQPRAGSTGGVIMGQLYVIGGTDGEQALASCDRFDPAEMAWSPCPEMTQPRVHAGAAVVLNKLYIFGGQDGAADHYGEVYDPAAESWEPVNTPMLAEHPGWAGMGVVSVETKIYTLGGVDGEALLADNYVYTPLLYQFFIPAASSGGEPEE
jgi:DNA-binding CsgD family transcriptional regulator